MKALALLTTLLLTFHAQAEVKPLGTFVPSLCSTHQAPTYFPHPLRTDIVAVASVCVGKFTGFPQDIVQLRLNDGSVREYAISIARPTPRPGVSSVGFIGNLAKIRAHDPIHGLFTTINGIRVSYQIELRTQSNLSFHGNMEPVYTTKALAH